MPASTSRDFTMIGVCDTDPFDANPCAPLSPNFSIFSISSSLLHKPPSTRRSAPGRLQQQRRRCFVPMVSNNDKHADFIAYHHGTMISSVHLSDSDAQWIWNAASMEKFRAYATKTGSATILSHDPKVGTECPMLESASRSSSDSVLTSFPGENHDSKRATERDHPCANTECVHGTAGEC